MLAGASIWADLGDPEDLLLLWGLLRGQDVKTGGTDRSARWGSGSSRQSEMRVVGGYRRVVSLMAKGSALGAEGPGRESWSCLSLGLGLWAFT